MTEYLRWRLSQNNAYFILMDWGRWSHGDGAPALNTLYKNNHTRSILIDDNSAMIIDGFMSDLKKERPYFYEIAFLIYVLLKSEKDTAKLMSKKYHIRIDRSVIISILKKIENYIFEKLKSLESI